MLLLRTADLKVRLNKYPPLRLFGSYDYFSDCSFAGAGFANVAGSIATLG